MKCILCKKGEVKTIRELSSELCAKNFCGKDHKNMKRIIEELWGEKTCKTVRCEECSFTYTDPFIAGDSNFYNEFYRFYKGNYPEDKFEFILTRKRIKNGNIIDIGAGEGNFINKLENKETYFTEYEKNNIKNLKELGHKEIDLDNCDIRFDNITLFQTLEHISNLDNFVERINKISKKGTKLFISVPYKNKIDLLEDRDILQDIPPNHISRWGYKHVKLLFKDWDITYYKKSQVNINKSLNLYCYSKEKIKNIYKEKIKALPFVFQNRKNLIHTHFFELTRNKAYCNVSQKSQKAQHLNSLRNKDN